MKSAQRRAFMPEFEAGPRLEGRCRGALPVKSHLTEPLVLQSLRAGCEPRHIRCRRCLSGGGDICRSARLAVKSAGTVWANPSRGGDAKPPVRAVFGARTAGLPGQATASPDGSNGASFHVMDSCSSSNPVSSHVHARSCCSDPRDTLDDLAREQAEQSSRRRPAVLSVDFAWRAK